MRPLSILVIFIALSIGACYQHETRYIRSWKVIDLVNGDTVPFTDTTEHLQSLVDSNGPLFDSSLIRALLDYPNLKSNSLYAVYAKDSVYILGHGVFEFHNKQITVYKIASIRKHDNMPFFFTKEYGVIGQIKERKLYYLDMIRYGNELKSMAPLSRIAIVDTTLNHPMPLLPF
jgi:hypothetical protein